MQKEKIVKLVEQDNSATASENNIEQAANTTQHIRERLLNCVSV